MDYLINKEIRRFFHRFVLTILLCSSCYEAAAEVKIYEEGDTKLAGYMNIQAAVFNSDDSYFGAQETFIGEDVDRWTENTIEIGIVGEVGFLKGSLFAELSALYSGTYGEDASGLVEKGDDPNQTKFEQSNIGWRSGRTFESLGEDALTIKYGSFDYSIGTGIVINDGGSDGGERGGWWMGARKTFGNAGLVSLETGPLLMEAFYLENRTRHNATKGKARGVNIEYDFETIGLELGSSWFLVSDRDNSTFKDYDVYSFRAGWQHELGFEVKGEYVDQGKNNRDAEGWFVQPGYQWKSVRWLPKLSYRYAHFSGDDLNTGKDEGFKTTAYGSHDWGEWFQGEIMGNYPLDNSNLNTHTLRLEFQPREDVAINIFYYIFKLDEKHVFGSPVSSDKFGDETNFIVDWSVNDKVTISGVLGLASPDDAAKEWTGGDDDWLYSMFYISYSL